MPVVFRLLHFAGALVFGVAVSFAIAGFGRMADPSEYAQMQRIDWLMLIGFFGAPLWIPAAIPSRYPRLLHATRLIGAVLLMLSTLLAATVIPHNFLFGGAATLLCATFLLLALWPEIHTYFHHST